MNTSSLILTVPSGYGRKKQLVSALPSHVPDDLPVGPVDLRSINGVQVDLRSPVRIVSHSLADHGNGNVHVTCNTGPRMPGHVSSERNLQSDPVPYFL